MNEGEKKYGEGEQRTRTGQGTPWRVWVAYPGGASENRVGPNLFIYLLIYFFGSTTTHPGRSPGTRVGTRPMRTHQSGYLPTSAGF